MAPRCVCMRTDGGRGGEAAADWDKHGAGVCVCVDRETTRCVLTRHKVSQHFSAVRALSCQMMRWWTELTPHTFAPFLPLTAQWDH